MSHHEEEGGIVGDLNRRLDKAYAVTDILMELINDLAEFKIVANSDRKYSIAVYQHTLASVFAMSLHRALVDVPADHSVVAEFENDLGRFSVQFQREDGVTPLQLLETQSDVIEAQIAEINMLRQKLQALGHNLEPV